MIGFGLPLGFGAANTAQALQQDRIALANRTGDASSPAQVSLLGSLDKALTLGNTQAKILDEVEFTLLETHNAMARQEAQRRDYAKSLGFIFSA